MHCYVFEPHLILPRFACHYSVLCPFSAAIIELFIIYNVLYKLNALGYDLKKISQMVSKIYDIEIEEIYSKGRRKVQVEARDLLCYWAVRELGISCTDLAKQLEMTQPGVGYAVNRGEKIAKEHNYQLQ